ncbi:MAG: nicotinate (nicotinamide) nucleotide adenylyltransferase [Candidatus Eremiobacteraeota bacterium]|nr:nicotinate (nicotinamide) nucleotide adenylyltransferase [Candidatus Eremiobacteraeota bacterium]
MKIGLFGGTFDPIHNAHLFIAESARCLEALDKVLFVPTNPVHHRAAATASAEDRCAMIVLAIASNPGFGLERIDLDEGATGYTADLLPRLRAKYPGDEFSFIIGADSLTSGSWVRMEEVLSNLERFVIAPRAGVPEGAIARAASAFPSNLRDRIKTLHLPEIPESSTLVRKLLSEGKSVRYLVPEPVWRYIEEHQLYDVAARV